jgi:hypothetical protein
MERGAGRAPGRAALSGLRAIKCNEAYGQKHRPRQMPAARCDERYTGTYQKHRCQDTRYCARRERRPLGQQEQQRRGATPSHASEMPRETQGADGELRPAKKLRQVAATKQANENVFLAQEGMRDPEANCEDCSQEIEQP